MPLNNHFYPKPGHILMCDFSGFKAPEMVKVRPVLVLAGAIPGRSGLATVVALSTRVPDAIQAYHYCLPKASLPRLKRFQNSETWVKGDMLYTVSHERLDSIRLGKDRATGKRIYYSDRLGRDQMKKVYGCVLSGLHLSAVVQHL